MSDDVQKTIITSLATAAPLMLMYWLQHKSVMRKMEEVKTDVKTIEKATNSMKDALVQSTKEASLLAGHAQGVKDEKIFQADKAIGDSLLTKAAAITTPIPVKDDNLAKVVKDAIKEKNIP